MKYQLLPRLSPEEFEALERSIIAHGVLVPVEYDEAGEIIDGHHRVEICESLGLVDWPRFVRKGLSEVDKRALSRELNFARRHLTTAQKQAVISDQLRDTPSISSRAIAGMLGVDPKTVSAMRSKLVSTGEIPQFEETTGKDGKDRPARKTIKTAFVPDRENVGEFLNGAKIIRAEKQKLAHTVRLAHMDMVRETGRATAPGKLMRTYPVGYADPPWKFGVRSEETGREKSAENHYPTMTTDEIIALFRQLDPFSENAVFFLWATNPMLPDGLRLLAELGFTYVHNWVWDKEVAGTGYWGRDRHEHLLIGRRGDIAAPLPGTQPETVHRERKGRHSQKPDFYAEQIEKLFPGVAKLEMFCRAPRPGWDHWGFEAGEAAAPPISPSRGEKAKAAPPAADDRPSVTAAEFAEFRMLGAVADGIKVSGPLFETLNEQGLIWAGKELSVGGAKRLAELARLVEAASDGDAVNVAGGKKRGFVDALSDWTEFNRLKARDDLSPDEIARREALRPIVEAETTPTGDREAPPSGRISPTSGEIGIDAAPARKRRARKAVVA